MRATRIIHMTKKDYFGDDETFAIINLGSYYQANGEPIGRVEKSANGKVWEAKGAPTNEDICGDRVVGTHTTIKKAIKQLFELYA